MATTLFEQEKSVFFVIHQDGSTADAGGCTQDWWNTECPNGTEAETAAAMAKLFNSSAPLIEEEEAGYTGQDNRIVISGAAAAGVETGMVAYVIESDTPDTNVDTGRYKITAVGTNYIECDGIEGESSDDDTDVDVVIGGAFEYLQDALDETDATDHSVLLYVKSVDTLVASIDVDAGGGNNTKNTFKRIVGYNTSPGDMNVGGTYYESPFEILQNGSIDATKTVVLDADDGGFKHINIDADNIILANFHFSNLTGQYAILFSNTPKNIAFRNCRFSDVLGGCNSAAENILFESCYSHNDLGGHTYSLGGGHLTVLNCVGNQAAGKNFANAVGISADVIGCVIAGNAQYGVHCLNAGASVCVLNNTFYNVGTYGVYVNNSESAIVANNIFSLEPGAVALYAQTAGSLSCNDYNCFIETDGTPLTVGGHGSGYEVPVKGAHSVQVDPDFVDAANGDFRARNPLVLRGGRPGPDGKAAVIGAIGQEYQFAERARVMNAGRAGIIR